VVSLLCFVAILLCFELGYYVFLLIQKEVRVRKFEKEAARERMEEAMPPSALINQEHDLFF
jgi:hypothetical protein